jgi:ribonuclease HIII
MERVESQVGSINFRLPNIAEGPELLALCGFNSKNASDAKWLSDNDLLIMARVIKNMGHLLAKAVINGKEFKKYDKLLEERNARNLVMEMANKVIESIGGSDEKNE